MTKFIRVSYDLDPAAPVFKGNPENSIDQVDAYEQGKNWTSYRLTLHNHNGSHIDGPYHFDPQGKRLSEFPIEHFIFDDPILIDLPKKPGEEITEDDLAPHEAKLAKCDLLLVRTGFYLKRQEAAYRENNPWLGVGAARFIAGKLRVKAIGVDTISLASYPHLAAGGEAHQILLGKAIMAIEDLDLGRLKSSPKRFFAIPLFAPGIDSSPCTAFAEV